MRPRPRRWPRLAHFTLAALAVLAVLLVVVSLPRHYERLRTVCAAAECASDLLAPGDALGLEQAGLSGEAYAALTVGVYLGFTGLCWLMAAVLMWRRPSESMAVLAAATLVALGAGAGLGWDDVQPGWHFAYISMVLMGVGGLVYLFYLFPDGRFVPRWTRWAFVPWLAWLLLGMGFVVVSVQPLPAAFWLVMALLSTGLFGLGGLAQLYRYRYVSSPAQRQQTKWVVLGFAGLVVTEVVYTGYHDFLRPLLGQPPMTGAWFEAISNVVDALTLSLLPVSLGLAILRSRLWDIDLIIRRTLVYTSLTALLGAGYLGSVLGLQVVFQAVTGEGRNTLVTILSTLAIAALFGPVRGWVQGAIDRRFYRRRYDAAHALARFGTLARDDLDLDSLTESLVQTVDETLQPAHTSVWLRPSAASAAAVERPDPR